MQPACALQMIIPQIFVVQQRFNQFLNCADKSKNAPSLQEFIIREKYFQWAASLKNGGWILGRCK